MSNINILVTGCGGDLGASIARICKELNIVDRLIGCNNNERHFSRFLYDRHYLVNDFGSNEYFQQINDIIIKEKIDLVVPVSEIELRLIETNSFSRDYFTKPYLCANKFSLEVGLDKLRTIEFLKDNGLPYPKSYVFSNLNQELDYPFIIKSRYGYGSKSIHIIKDDEQRNNFLKLYPNFIAQEFIDVDDSEYTCGLFNTQANDSFRSIVLKRNLYEGTTSDGIVIESDIINDVLNNVSEGLNLSGSINVQLRLRNNVPIIFEINPRFSSTVRFRHMLGFQDFLWSLQDFLGINVDHFNRPMDGMYFYRESIERIRTI